MSDRILTVGYSQLVMPQDANVIGTLFGGQMISWMDIAASKAAHRLLKGTEADAAGPGLLMPLNSGTLFMWESGLILKQILFHWARLQ